MCKFQCRPFQFSLGLIVTLFFIDASAALAVHYPPSTSHSPVLLPPLHSVDVGYGALSQMPDEVRLDGLITGDIDSSGTQFQMKVCTYAAGLSSRSWLAAPTAKVIAVSSTTQFFMFGNPSADLVLHGSANRPFHVTVLGADLGVGKPFSARIVWIERVTAAEASFMANQNDTPLNVISPAPPVAPSIAVSRSVIEANGRNFDVVVVYVKLSTVRVRVGLAEGEVGATEPLDQIARDYGAIAAVNGSFFDCYDAGPEKMPDMEVISCGEPLFKARIGTLIGFTPDGECAMDLSSVADTLHSLDPAYPDDWASAPKANALIWQKVTEAVGAGPRLVRDGAISLSPFTEGFSSAEVLNTVARRSAVGYTSGGNLLLVTTTASIPDLAHIMRELGCAQAMNLDGGSSSGLWVRGNYLQRPGRRLSNALLILPK